MIEQIKKLCDGIMYNRTVPEEAKKLAKENGFVIIFGGSDDLMYCYGAESYLSYYCEHGYGRGGDNLHDISDKFLEKEAKQLGLKIWWCGSIDKTKEEIEGYSVDESGAFSYTVKDVIEFENFKVVEDNEVYCTGIIIKLPSDFKSELENYYSQSNL